SSSEAAYHVESERCDSRRALPALVRRAARAARRLARDAAVQRVGGARDRRRVAAPDARVRRVAGPPARRGAFGRSDDVVGADPGRAARARSLAGADRAGERDALRVERQAADARASRYRPLLPVVRVAVQRPMEPVAGASRREREEGRAAAGRGDVAKRGRADRRVVARGVSAGGESAGGRAVRARGGGDVADAGGGGGAGVGGYLRGDEFKAVAAEA